MFFILSRLFAFTASPWFYILTFLGIGYIAYTNRIKTICLSFSIILFFFFSNSYIYHSCLNSYTSPYISNFDTIKQYKYALLPGGITDYDHVRKRVEYGFAVDRLIDAVELYKSKKVEKLVFSGDGASIKSGNLEKFLLHMEVLWDIRKDDIIIEPTARNTFENIKYSLKLLPDMNNKNTIIINSAIYMKRTLQSCHQLGFYPAYYATDIKININNDWQNWIPDIHVMDNWMKLIHEWIGCIAYKFL